MGEFPQPALRITANYPATDGSCPEHIEVELNDPTSLSSALITDVIDALASVPRARYQPTDSKETQ